VTRRDLLITLALAAPLPAAAQLEDLVETGRRLLERQLDPAFLDALRRGDVPRLQEFLNNAAAQLQGEYVLDLAALRQAAAVALPLLESHPETRPYASWLKARADYFGVAHLLETRLPARRDPQETTPRVPTPNQQRTVWNQEIQKRQPPRTAREWVARLKPVFRKAGAPGELAWLAEVESSFDPNARSPVGAAGLYQLMPATAEELGLSLAPQDERFTPEKNARAAATYLRKLHKQFKDWQLALAAYNAGPGRISRLLENRRARSFDAIAPSLPAETQMYVPKFEAVLSRREGIALSALRA
jgi:membrane-bound lytic murein transglycosylase D